MKLMKKHLFLIWSLVAVLGLTLGIFKIARQAPQLTRVTTTQNESDLRLVAGAGSPAPSLPPRAPDAGGVKNIYGQEWINNANGTQTVIGPCGTAACTGVWNPSAKNGQGDWDPNYNKPGAATPVPKKPSSGGAPATAPKATTPTPTPLPCALREIFGPNVELRGKACKSAASCADVKLSYDDKTGLVVKTETATAADLKDIVYIEFVFETRTYRITVSGGRPGTSANQQPATSH